MVGHRAVAADPSGKGAIPFVEPVINGAQLECDLSRKIGVQLHFEQRNEFFPRGSEVAATPLDTSFYEREARIIRSCR